MAAKQGDFAVRDPFRLPFVLLFHLLFDPKTVQDESENKTSAVRKFIGFGSVS